jgi:hypothetical protein
VVHRRAAQQRIGLVFAEPALLHEQGLGLLDELALL